MKHDKLRSIGHNLADSIASGCSFLAGIHDLNVFAEAAKTPERFITFDFINGTTSCEKPSKAVASAAKLSRTAFLALCAKHKVPETEFFELTTTFSGIRLQSSFIVTVEDRLGRRSVTEYMGLPGRRLLVLDKEGRIRPKPVQRFKRSPHPSTGSG
jgi:hypothetical protein